MPALKDSLPSPEGSGPAGRAHRRGGPQGRFRVPGQFGAAGVSGRVPGPHSHASAWAQALVGTLTGRYVAEAPPRE